MRHLWQAVLMAWLTAEHCADAGQGDAGGGIPLLAPEALRALCRGSSDDHAIKLGYSALCEYRYCGDRRYLQLAYRKAVNSRRSE